MTRRRLGLAIVVALSIAMVAGIGAVWAMRQAGEPARPVTTDVAGAIPAAFDRRSYPPGSRALLRVQRGGRAFTLQIFRVGAERVRPQRDDVLAGTPVSTPRRMAAGRENRIVPIAIGPWSSGFYFAKLTRPGEVGYAPFVLRPSKLGESRVLVVMPTYTWQAYNFRDVDGDGTGDTWYADPAITVVDLARPYLNRGVPPHFRGYDRAFLRWLHRTGKHADVVADDDLETIPSGRRLAELYDLVVFPGHDEYVGGHVLDILRSYRDLGGNLAFLSADTFVYAVDRRGHLLHGRPTWGDRGRPAAPLTGSRYVGWFENKHPNRPYVVTGARQAPWLFAGTGLHNGDTFGLYGIEVDQRDRLSPPGTLVVARIKDIFGKGRSAEMTYYGTAAGAKVFAAGVMNFGGLLEYEPQSTIMENLWRRLARP